MRAGFGSGWSMTRSSTTMAPLYVTSHSIVPALPGFRRQSRQHGCLARRPVGDEEKQVGLGARGLRGGLQAAGRHRIDRWVAGGPTGVRGS